MYKEHRQCVYEVTLKLNNSKISSRENSELFWENVISATSRP